jgi:PAS domain S-box-containing protein
LAKGKTKGSLRSTDEPEGTTRAGDEARESAERYALVAEAITEGIYDWNMASDTLHLSVRLYAILGLAPGLLRAGDWNEHIHPDDFPAYRAALSRHFKGETERFDCEYRMRRGSGDFIWIADRGTCMRGEDSRAMRMVGAIRDITARKLAEMKLSASREEAEKARQQFRDAIESISEGIVLFDKDDRIVICNSNYQRYFADTAGEEVSRMVKPGALFWDLLRAAHEKGMLPLIEKEGIDAYIERRKAMWRNPQEPIEQLLSDGRWLQINEHKTADGGIATVYTDITEMKQRETDLATKTAMLESLSSQLSKYLSPQVYASIFAGEQSVEIASKRKKLTVFFSDIADFTGTTDSLESEELTNLLNHYLTEMSKIALDYGATIDKYVGDAIIAFFGDPETRGVKEDARTCVNMAIAMQRRMQELQSEWLDMGLERPFQLRIGINTGFCTVGNFGSEDRMDYTIIGNEVNLAARLESHAEVGGILLAHETYSLVKDTVLAEEGDTLTVKGFAKPVRTYSVVGLYDDLAKQGRVIRKDEDGLTLIIDRNKLTKKNKAEAIKAIKDVLSQLED